LRAGTGFYRKFRAKIFNLAEYRRDRQCLNAAVEISRPSFVSVYARWTPARANTYRQNRNAGRDV
jgi:hypothetical protein